MAESTCYLPHIVYKNLLQFINYRNLELVSGDLTNISASKIGAELLAQEQFTQVLQYNKYIILEAKDSSKKDRRYPRDSHSATHSLPTKTIIILLDQEGTYAGTAQEFTKLLNRVPHIRELGHKFNMDIILIAYKSLGTNILNKFTDYTRVGNETTGYIRIIPYEYIRFVFIPINHKLQPTCRILPRNEEKVVIEKSFTAKKNFPKERFDDAIAIWLGAEVGDMIEELLPSESSGIEINYRVVRP